MSEATIVTSIVLGQVSDSILALCDEQKIDIAKLHNAVNSALGQMAHSADKDVNKAIMAWSKATKKKNESFRLTEKIQKQFVFSGSNGGIRFYLFNQDLLDLEQKVGAIDLADWPSYLQNWVAKFRIAEPTLPSQNPADNVPASA